MGSLKKQKQQFRYFMRDAFSSEGTLPWIHLHRTARHLLFMLYRVKHLFHYIPQESGNCCLVLFESFWTYVHFFLLNRNLCLFLTVYFLAVLIFLDLSVLYALNWIYIYMGYIKVHISVCHIHVSSKDIIQKH